MNSFALTLMDIFQINNIYFILRGLLTAIYDLNLSLSKNELKK